MLQTIEQLQAKNAELTAEVERLKTYRETDKIVLGSMKLELDELRQQLAIAEEHNARLREALEQIVNGADECLDDDGWTAMVISMEAYHICDEALSIPASREALDKYVGL